MTAIEIFSVASGGGVVGTTLIYIGSFIGTMRSRYVSKIDFEKLEKEMKDDLKRVEVYQKREIKDIHHRIDQVLEVVNKTNVSIAKITGIMEKE